MHEMLAQVQYFPNDLNRRMSELVKRKIDGGVIRPTLGMEILGQYVACFTDTTYCDAPPAPSWGCSGGVLLFLRECLHESFWVRNLASPWC